MQTKHVIKNLNEVLILSTLITKIGIESNL